MSDPAPYVRAPWPTPRRPLPLWPLLVGPLLGLLVTVAPRQVHRATLGIGPAFGFGFGGFVGLVVALAILLVRRQFTPQTALVAVATLVVGIWLALSFQ